MTVNIKCIHVYSVGMSKVERERKRDRGRGMKKYFKQKIDV